MDRLPDFGYEPLCDGEVFDADFDSYDQRKSAAYYRVTVSIVDVDGKPREAERFFVEVPMWWAGEDWATPAFREGLRARLRDLAFEGGTNTEYRGSGTSA